MIRPVARRGVRYFASTAGRQTRLEPGDPVILQSNKSGSKGPKHPVFLAPLIPGAKSQTRWGTVRHDDILGKSNRDKITTPKGHDLRVSHPTLDEYTLRTSRAVTPIYPADANIIVSLLDIHADADAGPDSRLQILEAGSGNGALTLRLARAIHMLNPPVSPEARAEMLQAYRIGKAGAEEEAADSALSRWKSQRAASIMAIDVLAQNTRQTRKFVHGFRKGVYAGNVDVHTADVRQWLDARTGWSEAGGQEPTPFLHHIILDMPGVHNCMASAAAALHPDGTLILFMPSISQIQTCAKYLHSRTGPRLVLQKVLELGAGFTGGKEWDVRRVQPRALLRKLQESGRDTPEEQSTEDVPARALVEADAEAESEALDELADNDASPVLEHDPEHDLEHGSEHSPEHGPEHGPDSDNGYEWVCRPKVGVRLTGGGFLAVFRRPRYTQLPGKEAVAAL